MKEVLAPKQSEEDIQKEGIIVQRKRTSIQISEYALAIWTA